MPITPELAGILAMLAEARKAITCGKPAEGLRLITRAEVELATAMELDVEAWRRLTG